MRAEEKFGCGNGEPKPRAPMGGNLVERTRALQSFTVYIRGTKIPWAPESRAPSCELDLTEEVEKTKHTLYHPALVVWDTNDGRSATTRYCRDGFVHCGVWGVVN